MTQNPQTPIEQVQFLMRKAKASTLLIQHMKWMVQTVHQGYHHEQEGSWLNCNRAFCKGTLGVVEAALKL